MSLEGCHCFATFCMFITVSENVSRPYISDTFLLPRDPNIPNSRKFPTLRSVPVGGGQLRRAVYGWSCAASCGYSSRCRGLGVRFGRWSITQVSCVSHCFPIFDYYMYRQIGCQDAFQPCSPLLMFSCAMLLFLSLGKGFRMFHTVASRLSGHVAGVVPDLPGSLVGVIARRIPHHWHRHGFAVARGVGISQSESRLWV